MPCLHFSLSQANISNFILSTWILHSSLSDSLHNLYTTPMTIYHPIGPLFYLIQIPSTKGRCLTRGPSRGLLFISTSMWCWQCLKTLIRITRNSENNPVNYTRGPFPLQIYSFNMAFFGSRCFKAKKGRILNCSMVCGIVRKVSHMQYHIPAIQIISNRVLRIYVKTPYTLSTSSPWMLLLPSKRATYSMNHRENILIPLWERTH